MDAQDIEGRIRAKLGSFPAKARRVAERVLSDPSSVAFRSIGDVADELSVSRAQLVRVARLLGFDGWSGLKRALRRELLAKVSPAAAAQELDVDVGLPQELCRLERANIDETLVGLGPEAVAEFCRMAKAADTLYCMGWGISSIVAEWMYTRFTELGLKAVLMRRGSMSLLEQARGIGEDDMLVVCELPSYVIEVDEAVRDIAGRGARVVTLTDGPAAPICERASLRFYVGDRSPTFGSSLIGPMFAVHVLTSALAWDMGEAGRRALDAQKEGLSDQRVYYPAYDLRY